MAYRIQIPEAELDQAVETIRKGLTARDATLATVDFCKYWPIVKKVLEILKKVPAVSWIIDLVIAIGDAYEKKYCPAN